MRKYILIPLVFLFTYCVKKQGAAKPPVDIVDTTIERISFVLDGSLTDLFHSDITSVNNKVLVTGYKKEAFENQLISFHQFTICFDNKSFNRQKLFKMNSNSLYSDSSKAWASFGTLQEEGDVVCEVFEVNENDTVNNWVKITKQENDFEKVWGNFSISLNKVYDCSSRFYSDKIVIKNGYFRGAIKRP